MGKIWTGQEGWICLIKGLLQHPLSSECCDGHSRSGEVKFLITTAMEETNWHLPEDRNLIKSFNLKKVLNAVLSCKVLVDKITKIEPVNLNVLDMVNPREKETGDWAGLLDHESEHDINDDGSSVTVIDEQAVSQASEAGEARDHDEPIVDPPHPIVNRVLLNDEIE